MNFEIYINNDNKSKDIKLNKDIFNEKIIKKIM